MVLLKKHMDACASKNAVPVTSSSSTSSSSNENKGKNKNKKKAEDGLNVKDSVTGTGFGSGTGTGNSDTVNNYDINMTFGKGNAVQVDVKKQTEQTSRDTHISDVDNSDSDSDNDSNSNSNSNDDNELKDMLRPKISHSYQDEIDKLENLIDLFKNLYVSDDPSKKDLTISHLKSTIGVLMTQSQNLIKEMKVMAHRNSYYKNNIMLASYLLDRSRQEVPDDEEEFEAMFTSKTHR
jgi:hypothetical protein